MFRGRNQEAGKWVTMELTDVDMKGLLDMVTKFNIEAWKESVRAVRELAEGDFVKDTEETNAVRQFFDKLSIQTFSVVKNRVDNLRT